jgi:murein DD-endopeptidase MepM/ murein hydrolase activator NlpD
VASRHSLLLLAALLLGQEAAARCDEDWLGITETASDGTLNALRASNLSPYPLTLTVRLWNRNLRIDGDSTVTRTLAAGEERELLQFGHRNPERPGRVRYSCEWTVGDQHARHEDDRLYLLPYSEGKSYRVLQGYGSRFSHTGREQYAVDFKMPEGTPVHAARDGVVARIEEAHDIGCWEDGCGKYANFIVVLHDDHTTGEYYHLQQDGALVEPGQRIRAGELIGLSGNTGHTTTPHLHFAVYRAVDWGNTQSIAVRFLSSDGIVSFPRRGRQYPAASADELQREILGGAAGQVD